MMAVMAPKARIPVSSMPSCRITHSRSPGGDGDSQKASTAQITKKKQGQEE
jgi:hypothetical protein